MSCALDIGCGLLVDESGQWEKYADHSGNLR